MQFLKEFYTHVQSQVSNKKATSRSQVGYEGITSQSQVHHPVSQVNNNEATNYSQIGIVTQKWRILIG